VRSREEIERLRDYPYKTEKDMYEARQLLSLELLLDIRDLLTPAVPIEDSAGSWYEYKPPEI
jgi:hypothetical protein